MAQLHHLFLDKVAAIGVPDPQNSSVTKWIATGFFYAHTIMAAKSHGQIVSRTYLVTARHVLTGKSMVKLRLNPPGAGTAQEVTLDLDGSTSATSHRVVYHPNPDVDVCVVGIDMQNLAALDIKASGFHTSIETLSLAEARNAGVFEGNQVFALGFPLGLAGTNRLRPIVRTGAIASIQESYDGERLDFLADLHVYPGNSGGPLILCPEAFPVGDTPHVKVSSLLGLVKSYVPYQDVAISLQTNRLRQVSEENSGLAAIEPVDRIVEAIEEHLKTDQAWPSLLAKLKAEHGC